jgi:cytochrome c553
MPAMGRRCELAVVSLVAATAILLTAERSWSAEKTEVGVHLEFWKGHFDRNANAFHDWDNQKEIPAVCARCHGADSLPEYLAEGKNMPAAHAKNGLACTDVRCVRTH